MLFKHAELLIKVNEAGPREGVQLDHLAHAIGGFEFNGKTGLFLSLVTILFIERDDVASLTDAGTTPRCLAEDECQIPFVIVGGTNPKLYGPLKAAFAKSLLT